MPLPQILDRGGGEGCTPGEPVRNCLFKVFEIALMNRGRLMGLDSAENFPRVCPEIGCEGLDLRPFTAQRFLPAVIYLPHRRLTVVQIRPCYSGNDYVLRRCRRLHPEQRSSQRRPIAQIAKKPSQGVERSSQVPATLPGFLSAESESRTVAGHSAERRRHADGAAGICADGGNSRALLHTRRTPARRPSRELQPVAGLQAVAVIFALARDAVGKLMQMGLAHDHSAGLTQTRRHR